VVCVALETGKHLGIYPKDPRISNRRFCSSDFITQDFDFQKQWMPEPPPPTPPAVNPNKFWYPRILI